MTKAVRDRILKDANADISDHLRNHIHLTNCIHLKNHIHKQSPMALSDRSLMRDLIVLQRSRSLRDPSASPPSWHKGENDPPPVPREARFPSSKVSPAGGESGRRAKREESSRISNPKIDVSGGNAAGDASNDRFSGNSASKSRKSKQKGKQQVIMKTLSEQLDSDAVASSDIRFDGRRKARQEKSAEASAEHVYRTTTTKRRRFRRARRHRVGTSAGPGEEALDESEMSVASNTPAAQISGRSKHRHDHEEEEYGRGSMTRAAPGNGCGIPWNWSSIHHRGKTFLDMAGRSLSCGLSDPRMKRSGHGKDVAEMPMECSGNSSSSSEAHPLLVDGSGSQESSENAVWARRYSGELGIYAGNLFRRDFDSDLASEARSGERQKSRNHRGHGRHQNLTQKYTPRNFRDLVGQSLVVQALSNAVARRKVGLLYVFYGPHGTGKTSCARIFSRALNCQSSDRPKPCGFCNSCVAHDKGKSRSIKEVGPVSNFDFERIMDLLDNMAVVSQLPSHYRVFIFDDCDTLSPECWSAISKVIDRAPRRVVFILVCSSLDVLPHIIISRCQKFFFPKLKDADIIYTLQWIATKECLEIDKDALKLIASRSDGSLRDAEMTLDQLSLLGQRISVPLVQELVGLISDEKLVDLLDLALSADTVNTVKNLRVIMETGVDPLGLMSQLATIITDVLAGSYDFTRGRPRRKFFRNQPLSKEDMEKLRQALKTLSEAEKQLRTSNDKLTWLTAALLQLAPDPQYLLPSSSAGTSLDQTPLPSNNPMGEQSHVVPSSERGLTGNNNNNVRQSGTSEPRHSSGLAVDGSGSVDRQRQQGRQVSSIRRGIEEIWLEVLDKIQYNGVREFLHQEGKLVSVSFGAAPTAQLMFSSHLTKSSAEKFRGHILHAFEAVLGSPLTIEIRCEPPIKAKLSSSSLSQMRNAASGTGNEAQVRGTTSKSEIVEVEANAASSSSPLPKGVSVGTPQRDPRRLGEQNRCRSIVRSKVSLAHVIQQAEGCSQHGVWSKRKAVSIAEKLEQENLRLEPRSRSLLCWKATRVTRRKLSRLRIRARKSRSLLKLVSCGECLSTKSPR